MNKVVIQKNIFYAGVLAGFMCFLTACGGSEETPSLSKDKVTSTTTNNKTETPPKAPSRKCPAEVTSAPRPEGTPVDDIVGIRPGMSYDDVIGILACRDDVPLIETAEKWNIQQTHGFPLRQVVRASNGTPCSGQEIVRAMSSSNVTCDDGGYRFKAVKNITQEFDVVFTGMPGKEAVGAFWRRNTFAEGEQPAVESLMQSLNQKYGEPHVTEKDRQGRTNLSWQYDLLGRPMSNASRNFNQCRNSVSASFAAGHGWSSACGLTIKVTIAPVYGNDLLAREMNMGIMHQKNFYDAGKTFEQELAAANEARKSEAAAEAAKKGVSPDL